MNILVTGANRGLGSHIAAEALARGHQVIAAMRNPSGDSTHLIEDHPDKIARIRMDVEDEASIVEAARLTAEQFGHVDVIVNNAGILLGRDQKLEELDFQNVERTFQVNLYGPMKVCKHFLPLLQAGSRQTLLNISSEAGANSNAYGGDYAYALSKAALNYFSAQVRKLLQDQGIRVFAVHPGWIRTDMGGEKAPGDPVETAAGLLDILEGKMELPSDRSFIDFRGRPMS